MQGSWHWAWHPILGWADSIVFSGFCQPGHGLSAVQASWALGHCILSWAGQIQYCFRLGWATGQSKAGFMSNGLGILSWAGQIHYCF